MTDIFEFTATLQASDNKLWGCHFVVPTLMAQTLLENDAKRVVCTLNQIETYQCGLVPIGKGEHCITVNTKIQKKLGIKPGALVQASLRKDNSEYGLPMPEELAAVLADDEAGNKIFHELTPGKIRTLLYLIALVKNSDKRIHRAITVVEHLKVTNGKINFRQLNQEIKENDK